MNFKDKSQELKITWLSMFILAVTAIYDFIFRAGIKFPRIILLVVTIWGAYIVYKKSFLRKSKTSYYMVLIFIFLAMYFGNVWDFYGIPHYDKFLHLGSGAIIAIIGYAFFIALCGQDGLKVINPVTSVVFVIIFSAAAAGIWEIWEFTTDSLFGLTAQNNSLNDTMWDIICGTLVGIITSIPIYMYSKGKNVKFIGNIIKEMQE
ncbi:hypothetical protein [Clostridium septicum]|uniref:DUF2238 domain-containing protein n=2 Tax=Clostridium septicum TaxID=1504 RepID=A0ABY5AX91_CLOSE|nr:hypothetical protein [Clostridium septicum]MDU1314911.1 hypothetical protein [Clostridium septicum]UEC21912.1 hypothetical protein LK444_06005 [Clostridium septicum]USS00057.1 hypothetical protein NH397_11190 [Clostridium septicum]WLF68583.1 hypothetical protein Q6375_11380 [Clostridium septicum]